MQKIFLKYIIRIVFISSSLLVGLSWLIQSQIIEMNMVSSAKKVILQIDKTLENNTIELQALEKELAQDYLTRARTFAYMIEKDPDILNNQKELNKVKDLLNVDELHVIDENGILFAGTIPDYFGLDFHDDEQTKEFLSILEDSSSYLVQDIQPNAAENKIFQYVGVSRIDKKGIVQVGLAPTRYLEAQEKNKLSYIFSRILVSEGTVLYAVDKEDGSIVACTDQSLIDSSINDLGISLVDISSYQDGRIVNNVKNKSYYVFSEEDDIILGMSQSTASLYQKRNEFLAFIFVGIFIIATIMILSINRLLKNHIVDEIHEITDKISDITDGKLNTRVEMKSNPEFTLLSDGINHMVDSILMTTVKVSKIIDVVNLPIGVFEINKNMNQVLVSDRLKDVLLLSDEEAEHLFHDKNQFISVLKDIMENEEDKEVYRIHKQESRLVEIHLAYEDGDIVGVVMDVTSEQEEKKKIKHERDYDVLTGLRNIRTFHHDVIKILKEENIKQAAIIMFDLDNFKEINDQYGHDWGDDYLRICARFFKRFENQNFISARRSGDEFVAFIYGYETKDEIIDVINHFFDYVASKPMLFPDMMSRCLSITAGLGWKRDEKLLKESMPISYMIHNSKSELSEKEDYIEKAYAYMMKDADEALYIQKEIQRGYFCINKKI